MTVLYVNPRLASYDVLDLSSHSLSEKKNKIKKQIQIL